MYSQDNEARGVDRPSAGTWGTHSRWIPRVLGGGEAADCVIAASAALGRAAVALAGVRCERSLLWVWVLFSFYFSLALTMLLIYLIRFLRLGFL